MSKVSICIPAYKDINGLRRLLKSLEIQNYKDFNIIITDDTPDDSIKTLIDEFVELGHLKSNSCICVDYIHNDTPLGPAGNWNESISLATGEYVKIIHQDDFLTFEDSLYDYVSMLDTNKSAVMAFSGSRQIMLHSENPNDLSDFHDRAITNDQLTLIRNDYHNLFLGGFFGAPSGIIYRNCKKRFDSELSWLIDGDFYMNLLSERNEFVCTDKPLISICESETQLTNSCINNAELVLREHKHLFNKYNLYTSELARLKMIQIVLDYKFDFSAIEELNIPKEEYIEQKKIHNKELMKFYKDLVLKKLHLKH